MYWGLKNFLREYSYIIVKWLQDYGRFTVLANQGLKNRVFCLYVFECNNFSLMSFRPRVTFGQIEYEKLFLCQGLLNTIVSSNLKTSIFKNQNFSWFMAFSIQEGSERIPVHLLTYFAHESHCPLSWFVHTTAQFYQYFASISKVTPCNYYFKLFFYVDWLIMRWSRRWLFGFAIYVVIKYWNTVALN